MTNCRLTLLGATGGKSIKANITLPGDETRPDHQADRRNTAVALQICWLCWPGKIRDRRSSWRPGGPTTITFGTNRRGGQRCGGKSRLADSSELEHAAGRLVCLGVGNASASGRRVPRRRLMARLGICVAVLCSAVVTCDTTQAQTSMWSVPQGFPSGTNFGYGRVSSRRGTYALPTAQIAVPPPTLAAPAVTFRPLMPVTAGYASGCHPCHGPCGAAAPSVTRRVYYAPTWPLCCGY